MPRGTGIVIGGCWYHLQSRERCTGSIAAFAFLCGRLGAPFRGVEVIHTSNLPQGRALWLRRMVEDPDLRWAISVDADSEFNAAHLIQELERVDGQIAIGLAPVRIGGTPGLCNLNLSIDDERISESLTPDEKLIGMHRMFAGELAAVLEGDRLIASGGFGLAVFNLEWFRRVWPDPVPERVSIVTGEDIEFCRSVRDRGGLIAALAIKTEHHEFKP